MRMFHHKVGDFPYTISVILYSKKDYKSLHRRNMTDISDDELSSIRGYSYLDNKYIILVVDSSTRKTIMYYYVDLKTGTFTVEYNY